MYTECKENLSCQNEIQKKSAINYFKKILRKLWQNFEVVKEEILLSLEEILENTEKNVEKIFENFSVIFRTALANHR